MTNPSRLQDALLGCLISVLWLGSGRSAVAALPQTADVLQQERQLLAVVRARPNDFQARMYLGGLYLEAGRPQDAIMHLRRAIDLAPDDGQARLQLAQSYLLNNELDLASETFRRTLKLRAGTDVEASACLALAGMYETKGLTEQAEQFYGRAYALRPELKELVFNAARIEYSKDLSLRILKESRCSDRWRIWAATVAGQTRDIRAVDPLIAVLGTLGRKSNQELRHAVAWALGRIGDVRAIGPLIEASRHDVRDTYMGIRDVGPVAMALAKFGHQAVEPLLTALGAVEGRRPNERLPDGVVCALGLIGDRRAVQPLCFLLVENNVTSLENILDLQPTRLSLPQVVTWALAEIGDHNAVIPMISALGARDAYATGVARQQLARMGRPAVEPLILALRHSNSRIRDGAADVLGKIMDVRAVEPLIQATQDENSSVRHSAVIALGFTTLGGPLGARRNPRSLEALAMAAQTDDSVFVRNLAVQILGLSGEGRFIDALITSLNDEDWATRGHAAQALGRLGDARCVEPLIDALQDESGFVREHAAKALGELKDPRAVTPLAELMRSNDLTSTYAAIGLAKIGAPGLDALLALLRDDPRNLAPSWAAEEMKDPQAVDRLIDFVRARITQGANVPDRRRPARKRAAHIRHVRQERAAAWAIEALGSIGDPRAVETLVSLLSRRTSPIIRGATSRALVRIGKPAVRPLIAALKKDPDGRGEDAALILGEMTQPRAVGPLIEGLKRSPTSYFLKRGISGLGMLAVPPLVDMLADSSDPRIRLSAADLLGRIGDVRAVDPVITAFDKETNWHAGSSMLQALGQLGGQRALETLLEAIGDERYEASAHVALMMSIDSASSAEVLTRALFADKPVVRQVAAKALGRLKDPWSVRNLLAAMTDKDDSVRNAAAEAISKGNSVTELNIHHALATEPILAALSHNNAFVRRSAAAFAARLAQDDPWARDRLMTALEEGDLEIVAYAYSFFISQAPPDSEEALVNALNAYGHADMARGFAQCKNDQLSKAGREWLAAHDLEAPKGSKPGRWRTRRGSGDR